MHTVSGFGVGTKKKRGQVAGRVKIPLQTQWRLWTLAGRRCSFPGCNELLDISRLTLSTVNHSNIAHIVPVHKNWPRGSHSLPAEMINDISNLMLVCTECHKVIDDLKQENIYTVEVLRKYKREHEARIEYLGGLAPSHKTVVVRCRANIQDEEVQIPFDHIAEAVLPRYPRDRRGIEIDMTKASGEDSPAYWASKKSEISRIVERELAPGVGAADIDHLSVFALGPMPLLMHLGNSLSNKIPTELFQRHRDNEKWNWRDGIVPAQYTIKQHQGGTDPKKVALLLALSGPIHFAQLPSSIDGEFSVYEITLCSAMPTPTFLNTVVCLQNFKTIYRKFMSEVMAKHEGLRVVQVFPAVPAPVAVLCGRELLHKVDPILAVHDFNKNKGGFDFAMEVNDGHK